METPHSIPRSWGRLAFSSAGHGEPVILLHPLAQNGGFWRPFTAGLAADFQTITIDARGHGHSQWDGSPFSIDDLAQDVAAVADELAMRRIRLIGMSMGGCVAISLAASRPDLVQSLVLADTTSDYGPDKAKQWAERAHFALAKPRPEQLSFQVNRWFSPAFVEQNPAEVRRVCDIFLTTQSRSHAMACCALGEFNATESLASISSPTLITVGEEDLATPLAMAKKLQEGIIGSSLEVIPSARHFALIEAKANLTNLLGRVGIR